MKLTNKEQAICDKYSQRDEHGKVHCPECPLALDRFLHLCKANCEKEEWEEFRGLK